MHRLPWEYTAWPFQGEPQTVAIATPLSQAIAQAGTGLPAPLTQTWREARAATLLPAVVVGGLLDGINPCAFAVILLLIAFLFTIRQSRARILQLGGIYIAVIFAVYFGIGLGILRAVSLFGDGHLIARAGAWLLIVLGLINLKDYVRPEWPIHLTMPAAAHREVNRMLKQATVPATVVMGFLIGLCTFPCSGGIYVSVLTLLAAKTTAAWGLGYLALYNLLFVAPLVAILLAAGNRTTAKAWAAWERAHVERIHLWYGLLMVAMGAVLLVWVI
jgi:cytochrome c biogenesis protein CcdA